MNESDDVTSFICSHYMNYHSIYGYNPRCKLDDSRCYFSYGVINWIEKLLFNGCEYALLINNIKTIRK